MVDEMQNVLSRLIEDLRKRTNSPVAIRVSEDLAVALQDARMTEFDPDNQSIVPSFRLKTGEKLLIDPKLIGYEFLFPPDNGT